MVRIHPTIPFLCSAIVQKPSTSLCLRENTGANPVSTAKLIIGALVSARVKRATEHANGPGLKSFRRGELTVSSVRLVCKTSPIRVKIEGATPSPSTKFISRPRLAVQDMWLSTMEQGFESPGRDQKLRIRPVVGRGSLKPVT